MGSPAAIDFERMLAPLSGENAAGEDLRADTSPTSAYYQLKDARKSARAKERTLAVDDTQIPDTRADWRPVFDQSVELLSNRSKDLELVAWLTESLVRLHGFAGLRDGFRFTREFVSQYWDSFYPAIGEDGIEERIAPLAGLNGQDAEGTLIVPIRNVLITEEHSVGAFATWHFQQAVSLQQLADPEVRERRIEAGAVSMESIDKASLESDAEFLKRNYDDLQECRTEFDALSSMLDEKCGGDLAPPSSNIKNELSACLEAAKYVGRNVLTEPVADGEASEGGDMNSADGSGAAVPSVGGSPANREQAFQQLLLLADFFRRTEPHSPLSYTIERVVRWGRMPLPELLGEIIAEEDARDNLFWLAGIKKPGADS